MWYIVYEEKTGKPISTGTELANPLPKGLVAKELGEDWDWENEWNMTWHEDTLEFTVNPPVVIPTKQDRLNDISANLGLTAEQIQKLEKFL